MIFLDRDGTLNVDKGSVHRPEDWEFTDRAAEALRELLAAGYAIALVTNQSGVGRGYFTLDDVQALHQHVEQRLADGVRLDTIAVCPHLPDAGCACRKPRSGMARQVEAQLREPIAYDRSWVIGDKLSDLELGRALRTRVALLNSRPDLIADSLYQAAQAVVSLTSP